MEIGKFFITLATRLWLLKKFQSILYQNFYSVIWFSLLTEIVGGIRQWIPRFY